MAGAHDSEVRYARRRRVGGFPLLLLFVAGVAAAPVLDGWLHATQGTAGAAADAGDCAVHQLAGTQLAVTPAAPAIAATRGEGHREAILGPRAPRDGRGDRLTPPSRAPPA